MFKKLFFKVGLGTAVCSGTLLCKAGEHLYCNNSAASYSNTCECQAPWILNTATLACDCPTPNYRLDATGTSCCNKILIKSIFLINYY